MIALDDDEEMLLRQLAQEIYQGKKGSLSDVVATAIEEFAEKRKKEQGKKAAAERILKRIEKGRDLGLGLDKKKKVYESREELYEDRVKKILRH